MGKLTRPKPTFEREPTTMDRPERIVHIQKKYHFTPRTNQEAASVMAIMGRPESPYRMQGFLNQVYQRQLRLKKKKYFEAYSRLTDVEQRELYGDMPEIALDMFEDIDEQAEIDDIRGLAEQSEDMDPQEAIRAIAHSFADHALSADDSLLRAVRLSYELERSGVSAKEPFTTAFATDEWTRDPNLVATLTDFTRHVETEAFVRDGKLDSIGKKTSVLAEKGEHRIARIERALAGRNIADIQEVLLQIAESEENRRDFWAGQLEDAKKHLFVRDIANRALELIR